MTPDRARIAGMISADIVSAARQVMSSSTGVNDKVGVNTLTGSNLYNQIRSSWKFGSDLVIDTVFNGYLEYIEHDRPPKYGRRPPVMEIAKWLRRKQIVSSNENILSVAYAVSYAIWRDGHRGRKVFDRLEQYIDGGFDGGIYEDWLTDLLFAELDKYFTQK